MEGLIERMRTDQKTQNTSVFIPFFRDFIAHLSIPIILSLLQIVKAVGLQYTKKLQMCAMYEIGV